jgi:hypothetical protein
MEGKDFSVAGKRSFEMTDVVEKLPGNKEKNL